MTILQGVIWLVGMLLTFLWGAHRYYSDGYIRGWLDCQEALKTELNRLKGFTADELKEEIRKLDEEA